MLNLYREKGGSLKSPEPTLSRTFLTVTDMYFVHTVFSHNLFKNLRCILSIEQLMFICPSVNSNILSQLSLDKTI